MTLIEVGTPYLHRQHLAPELALLPAGRAHQRRPGCRATSSTAAAPRGPISIVCGLGLANPLEAEGLDHQMVDRTAVHADPGLRAGRRSRRTVRAAAGAPRAAGGLAMQLTLWTYEGPPHVGAMRVATGDARPALCAARAAGRHLRRSAVHDDRAARRAPAGHLHDLPGARPRRRHRRAVQDRGARRLRALQAAGDDRRRLLHRRTDPGRSRRPRRARSTCRSRSFRSNCPPIRRRRTGARRRPSIGWCARSPARAASARAARTAALQPARARPRSASAIATTSRRSRRCSTRLGVDVDVVAPLGATPADLDAARRGRLQRRALSRDRAAGGAMAGEEPRPALHARPCRSASARRATSSPRSRALAGVDAAHGARRGRPRGCPGTRARSIRPI